MHILIQNNIIPEQYRDLSIKICLFIDLICLGLAIFTYKDYDELLLKEKEKGEDFNNKWKLITWLYMIISIVITIVCLII